MTFRMRILSAVLLALAVTTSPQASPAGDQHVLHWSTPVSLGPPVNTEFGEFCPSVPRSGRSLYFFSDRPDGSFGGNDLWVSQRQKNGSWGPAQNLGPRINTPYDDSAAWLSPDGYSLYFSSNRPGGLGGLDVWVTRRTNKHDDFSWGTPVNITAVNSPFNDFGPMVHYDHRENTLTMYFHSNRPGGPGLEDIYSSVFDRKARSFRTPTVVAEVSSPALDRLPALSPDGRVMLITSDRPGTLGSLDLWAAKRLRSRHDHTGPRWSTPVNVTSLNSIERDSCARYAPSGRLLYLHSTRDGGFPMFDLYVSKPEKPRD